MEEGSTAHFIYSITLIALGLGVITLSRRITAIRNRAAESSPRVRAAATPTRYIILGLVLLFLGVSSYLGYGFR